MLSVLLRRTGVYTLKSGVLTTNAYTYDAASRLSTVSDGNSYVATYSYLANSPLVSQIAFANNGTTQMTTTKSYDYLNRLTSISSVNASSAVLDSHNYNYNPANQRTAVTNADGTYWAYGYDKLGQVTNGVKHWPDGTVVAGQQFGYGFDNIGNRTTTSAGGDQWGQYARTATYTANSLNQYTNRTVPGAVDIIGAATNTATVTVNNQSTYRHGNYYWTPLPLNNSSAPVYTPVTTLAVLNAGTNFIIQSNITGNVFLPQTPESFAYDADGNLTNDGRWEYVWDGENRLIAMTNIPSLPAGAKMGLAFAYDSKSRRIQKTVSTWSGAAYLAQSTNSYAYDGWNLLAILDTPSTTLLRAFSWGLDLSGSIQGAGGVGGLLSIASYSSSTTNCLPTYDGNGNVTALASTSGTLLANYEYGPFGEVIRATGPMAKLNPFTYQTEVYDWETDKYYWKNRFYDPSPGRWLSRDPIEESGGMNLYGFVGNDPVDFIDPDGFERIELWIAAFISPSEIRFPYYSNPNAFWHGDDRGFNPGTRPMSSRVWHWVVVETDPSKSPVVANISGTGLTTVTVYTAFGIETTAVGLAPPPPVATVTRSGCILNVSVSANTGNPLIIGAPHIKYSYNFSFDTKKGIMTVTGSHGVFPWHEVNTTKGSAVQFSPAPGASPGSLWHSPVPITPATFSIQTYPCCDAK